MENVGAMCEMTHFTPVPERRRIFISARVVGRFEVDHVISDKPFVAALCREYSDQAATDIAEQAQTAALEARIWQAMVEVRDLSSKLFTTGGGAAGDDAFPLETRRWCPDPAVRAGVAVAAGSDPALLDACEAAGLMGEAPPDGVEREGASERICSDALRIFSDAERRERLSFALCKALDVNEAGRLEALRCKDTAARLRMMEELVLEGRGYLAARATLKDMF